VRAIRVVLLLTLYGIVLLALLPFAIRLLVNLERALAVGLGALPAALATLALFGLMIAAALYAWYWIARVVVRRGCREAVTT
jgi:hypothetical protein